MSDTRDDTRWWFVVSPEFEYHEIVLDDGTGPWIPTRDYTEVEAETRREARSLAVKGWLAERGSYCYERKADGLNPYTGIEATSYTEAKTAARALPPTDAPDWCDTCKPSHLGATRWYWRDDPDEWGWYGTCDRESVEANA